MPRENKKRGRRMEGKKRKHEEDEEDESNVLPETTKRRKSEPDAELDVREDDTHQADFVPFENGDNEQNPAEKPFYGLLDEEEQEFFRHADDTLEADAFTEPEDKTAFLANVYREAEGKELKIANSQSCSRLLERLIQLSSPDQCRNLFHKFSGHFVHLTTHRFASHCCEALFLRAAPFVSEKLSNQPNGISGKSESATGNGETNSTIESRFLDVVNELDGSLGFLITDRYASHVLRVLLLILSGEPLASEQMKLLLHGKKKESITVNGIDDASTESKKKARQVPESFSSALEKLLRDSVAGLPTDKLRALATHPNASPTLQLLLRLELSHYGKQRAKDETSILRTLLPEEPITADSDSASFISGLIYDPVGSHLVENIVQHAPGKLFKTLYKAIFHDRLAAYARNEIACHVACRIIERLGHDDLLEAHELIVTHVPDLLRRNRTVVVRTFIERCTVRDIDTKAIAAQVYSTWTGPDGFEIQKLLKTEHSPGQEGEDGAPNGGATNGQHQPSSSTSEFPVTEPVKAHFNLLAQAMLLVPGSLSALVLDALIALDPDITLKLSHDPIVSRTIQAALTSKASSVVTTRKLVQHFYGHIGDMATHRSASHVVDCIWEGTHGLAFIRERIAEELAENEAHLRDSPFGRAVWKNWKMNMYKRQRGEWIRQSRIKASNDGFQSFSELEENKNLDGTSKTPLQLARERHAREKQKKDSRKSKGKGHTSEKQPNGDAQKAPETAAA